MSRVIWRGREGGGGDAYYRQDACLIKKTLNPGRLSKTECLRNKAFKYFVFRNGPKVEQHVKLNFYAQLRHNRRYLSCNYLNHSGTVPYLIMIHK